MAAVLSGMSDLVCVSQQYIVTGNSKTMFEVQIMLAVLSRGYDWEIDPEEPVKEFPLPMPVLGLPMTFTKLQKPVVAREE